MRDVMRFWAVARCRRMLRVDSLDVVQVEKQCNVWSGEKVVGTKCTILEFVKCWEEGRPQGCMLEVGRSTRKTCVVSDSWERDLGDRQLSCFALVGPPPKPGHMRSLT